jgi:hypothetical protein
LHIFCQVCCFAKAWWLLGMELIDWQNLLAMVDSESVTNDRWWL